MRYRFGATVVVEPVRLQRLEQERRSEDSFSFGHHAYPLRDMGDRLTISAEVESPRGMTPEQQKAFERAMNRMLRHFHSYIADEFSAIAEPVA